MAASIVWLLAGGGLAQSRPSSQLPVGNPRPIAWSDVAAVAGRLESAGVTASKFEAYLEQVRSAHARRVREGDLDHLIFYMLQSTRFTKQPPIEPALSAKALVEALDANARAAFLAGDDSRVTVPAEVKTRATALSRAIESGDRNPRLHFFRVLAVIALPAGPGRETALLREYVRSMRFLYQKEFVAQKAAQPASAVAELYRERGLSTDTAVEAGFLVSTGLGVAKGLAPDRKISRVLIIGPGLDLAPRTGLLEAGPPESYQPWAVIDALVGLGLSKLDDLVVVGADINTRVTLHLRGAAARPPRLTLVTEVAEGETLTLTPEYREYFESLGRQIGRIAAPPAIPGHLAKTIEVSGDAARALRGERLDIVAERLDGAPFDLVIATNILPYLDDVELTLAMSNIAAMVAPGGVFLHNERRPIFLDLATAVGLPLSQTRHAIIAQVRGAETPLFDSVFVHTRAK
jgi:hypothetical protein